jgi:DNA-binding transcriptional LysR family regulator
MFNRVPLSSLRSFEAAGRLLSFKGAADEVGVTPGAVSHAIAKLEDLLGVSLFIRTTRRIELTAEGETLLAYVGRGFEEVRLGLARVTTRGDRLMRLHAAPSFAAQFLAPRLPGFLAAHPGIDIRLAAGTDYARFKTDEFDADIIYGEPPVTPGLIMVALAQETVTPLCAPQLAASLHSPAGLLAARLIQSDNKKIRWTDWFTANAMAAPPPRGLRFDRSFLSIAAAVDGQGMALESTLLARRELADGRLVAPFLRSAANITYVGHFFIYPAYRYGQPMISRFLDWLLQELAEASSGEMAGEAACGELSAAGEAQEGAEGIGGGSAGEIQARDSGFEPG